MLGIPKPWTGWLNILPIKICVRSICCCSMAGLARSNQSEWKSSSGLEKNVPKMSMRPEAGKELWNLNSAAVWMMSTELEAASTSIVPLSLLSLTLSHAELRIPIPPPLQLFLLFFLFCGFFYHYTTAHDISYIFYTHTHNLNAECHFAQGDRTSSELISPHLH